MISYLWRIYSYYYDDLSRYFSPYNDMLSDIMVLINQHIKSNSTILDVGCGTGNYLSVLANQDNHQLFGLDLSPYMISRAITKLNGHFCIANSIDIPFNDNSFDVILSINSLYTSSDVDKTLSEYSRCLKVNGYLVISNPISPPSVVNGILSMIQTNGIRSFIRLLIPIFVISLINIVINFKAKNKSYWYVPSDILSRKCDSFGFSTLVLTTTYFNKCNVLYIGKKCA